MGRKNIIRLTLIILAVILIVIGILKGEFKVLEELRRFICIDCIGL